MLDEHSETRYTGGVMTIQFREIAMRVDGKWEMKKDHRFSFEDFVVREKWKDCPSLSLVNFLNAGKVVVEALLNQSMIAEIQKNLFK